MCMRIILILLNQVARGTPYIMFPLEINEHIQTQLSDGNYGISDGISDDTEKNKYYMGRNWSSSIT